MSTTTTTNMGLTVPGVGTEPGPNYASELNSNMTILDTHSHTAGNGVFITTGALNINAALPMNGWTVTNAAGVQLAKQSSASSTNGTISVTGVDLYYTDYNGNQIQMTASGAINATTSGISSGSATASFSAGQLIVNSATATPANIKAGSYFFGNNIASSNYAELSAPSSLAANYSMILPLLPASTSFVQLDASGNFTASVGVSAGITAANISAGTITTTQISSSAGILGSQLATSTSFSGKATQVATKNIAVSNTNATNGLAIIRTLFNANGTINVGEGCSVTSHSTGVYTVTWTTAFADTPSVTTMAQGADDYLYSTTVDSTHIVLATHSAADVSFYLIAIGQRA